jgi:hypothetical protein
MSVWGYTVERTRGRDHGSGGTRERLLAERADGIAKLPLPRPTELPSNERGKRLAELASTERSTLDGLLARYGFGAPDET